MHIDLPEKRYYKIGEVAKAFSVNTSRRTKCKTGGVKKKLRP
jgi:hypothetical protein